MVKSTPLLRKRIVKKRTLKFTRFQSDLYGGRLAESWRRPRGTPLSTQVSTTACVVASEATRRCPRSDTAPTMPPSSSFLTDSRSSSSTTPQTSTSSSWTTGLSAQRLPITSAHAYPLSYDRKELRSSSAPSRSVSSWPTLVVRSELRRRSRRHDLNLFKHLNWGLHANGDTVRMRK